MVKGLLLCLVLSFRNRGLSFIVICALVFICALVVVRALYTGELPRGIRSLYHLTLQCNMRQSHAHNSLEILLMINSCSIRSTPNTNIYKKPSIT
jgi:hypothetical protein